jgi:hypothetical protein
MRLTTLELLLGFTRFSRRKVTKIQQILEMEWAPGDMAGFLSEQDEIETIIICHEGDVFTQDEERYFTEQGFTIVETNIEHESYQKAVRLHVDSSVTLSRRIKKAGGLCLEGFINTRLTNG